MPDPSPDRYAVNIPAFVLDHIRAGGEWARENGSLDEYRAALREVEYRLSVEPDEWGESREFLAHMRVRMRCGTSRMITVLYGVDVRHSSIWVKSFRVNRNYRPRPGTG